MKELKLDINNNQGGHRRSLNDYLTITDSIGDLAKAFTDTNAFESGGTTVLSGLRYTLNGTNYILRQGWLVYQGKPVFVPTSTGTIATGEQLYIEIEDNPMFSGSDPVQYADGTLKSVHRERIGVVRTATTIPAGIDYVLPIQLNKGKWRNDIFPVSGLTGTTGCQINFFIKGKTVHLKVVMNNVTASGATFINVTLPNNLYPNSRELFPVTCFRNLTTSTPTANFICHIEGANLIIRDDTGSSSGALSQGQYSFSFSYTYELA
ncbi:MAG: hypothetical protein ACPG5P_04225 [Saprospiraceae bacterium]